MIDDYMKRYSISLEKCIWKLILKYHHTNSEITKMKTTAPSVERMCSNWKSSMLIAGM